MAMGTDATGGLARRRLSWCWGLGAIVGLACSSDDGTGKVGGAGGASGGGEDAGAIMDAPVAPPRMVSGMDATVGAVDGTVMPGMDAGVAVDGATTRDASGTPDAMTTSVVEASRPDSEGEPGNPFDLTGGLPHEGYRGTDPSYYIITGLEPGAVYTIVFVQLTGEPTLVTKDSSGSGSNTTCSAEPGMDVIRCATVADETGNVRFNTYKQGNDDVATYRIDDLEAGGLANEGTPFAPKAIDSLPLQGEAHLGSYYRVTGLDPLGAYTVTMPTSTGEPSASLYGTGEFFGFQPTCSVGSTAGCAVEANPDGELFLRVGINNHDYGVTYTIAFTPGGIPNQGHEAWPRDLTAGLPFAGSVELRNSIYRATGLTPGSAYTLTVSDITDRISVYFKGLGLAPEPFVADCETEGYQGDTVTCAGHAGLDGTVDVRVSGTRTTAGATYTLALEEGGIPNEGFSSDPIDITGQLPYAGSVHYGSSYYEVTGLEPGQSYTVTLSNPTQDVALVADGCSSNDGGTSNEACTTSAPSDGTLYIWVSYVSSPAGATYTIDVQ